MRSERELKRAKSIRSLIERKLFIVGVITSELKKTGITPIIVGGSAVEFYTSGAYGSLDIDLIAKKRETVDLLKKIVLKCDQRDLQINGETVAISIHTELEQWVVRCQRYLSGSLDDIARGCSPALKAYVKSVQGVLADEDALVRFGVRMSNGLNAAPPRQRKDRLATTWSSIKSGVQGK